MHHLTKERVNKDIHYVGLVLLRMFSCIQCKACQAGDSLSKISYGAFAMMHCMEVEYLRVLRLAVE